MIFIVWQAFSHIYWIYICSKSLTRTSITLPFQLYRIFISHFPSFRPAPYSTERNQLPLILLWELLWMKPIMVYNSGCPGKCGSLHQAEGDELKIDGKHRRDCFWPQLCGSFPSFCLIRSEMTKTPVPTTALRDFHWSWSPCQPAPLSPASVLATCAPKHHICSCLTLTQFHWICAWGQNCSGYWVIED